MFKFFKKSLGQKGEDIAVRYLQSQGLEILCTNYKTPFSEVDIIAKDGDCTVFVEVKARQSSSFGEPFEAVTASKQDKIKKSALYYQKSQGSELKLRFDIISITSKGSDIDIKHIKEAF